MKYKEVFIKEGCIYFDTSLKEMRHGRAVRHNKFCAEIVIDKKRYRFRSKSMILCEKFLKEIISKHKTEECFEAK